jgi:hypothetical protein
MAVTGLATPASGTNVFARFFQKALLSYHIFFSGQLTLN